jgi:hypothetical protein
VFANALRESFEAGFCFPPAHCCHSCCLPHGDNGWSATTPPRIPPQPPSSASRALSPVPPGARHSSDEIIDAGHHFFGGIPKGIASIVEKAVDQWGQPNGYILGEEAGGAFIGRLRYGDGTLNTKDAGDLREFWQGPTIGVDLGADGARTMMLVYNLPRTDAIYQQFNDIAGAAYVVAGLGITALTSGDEHMVVVPIRSGLGLRLGYNVGYLKFSAAPKNPF